MNKNQLPTILVVTSAAGHLIGNVIPTLEHVRDPGWPDHARFHALQAIGLLTGMDLIAIAVALGPLRRRDRWALWIELTCVLFAQGGYFASIAVLPKGRPRGAVFHALYACATAIFLAGLLLGQRSQRTQRSQRSQ
jgi:hypothetical protein